MAHPFLGTVERQATTAAKIAGAAYTAYTIGNGLWQLGQAVAIRRATSLKSGCGPWSSSRDGVHRAGSQGRGVGGRLSGSVPKVPTEHLLRHPGLEV